MAKAMVNNLEQFPIVIFPKLDFSTTTKNTRRGVLEILN
jgi:hypothetical protein